MMKDAEGGLLLPLHSYVICSDNLVLFFAVILLAGASFRLFLLHLSIFLLHLSLPLFPRLKSCVITIKYAFSELLGHVLHSANLEIITPDLLSSLLGFLPAFLEVFLCYTESCLPGFFAVCHNFFLSACTSHRT